MPRRRPDFGSGVASAEAAKLKKFSAGVPDDASSLGWGGGGSQNLWLSDAPRGPRRTHRSLGYGVGRTDSSITSGIEEGVEFITIAASLSLHDLVEESREI